MGPFKSQLTVYLTKPSDTQGFAHQTVHYFCHLAKGAKNCAKMCSFIREPFRGPFFLDMRFSTSVASMAKTRPF